MSKAQKITFVYFFILVSCALIVGALFTYFTKFDLPFKNETAFITLNQRNIISKDARYDGFPFYEKTADYVRIDALPAELTGNIAAHARVTDNPENENYFDTVELGQIVVNNYHQFDLNCPGLVRLEGTMTTLKYDSVLNLEKYTCLDFLDTVNWYAFTVDNGAVAGTLTNPFPVRQTFQLKLGEIKQTFALNPRQSKAVRMPINCDAGIGEFSQGLIQGRVEFEGPYRLFDHSIDIDFDAAQCPTSPKLNLITSFDTQFDKDRGHYAMEINKEASLKVNVKNEGSKDAKNLSLHIELPSSKWSETEDASLIFAHNSAIAAEIVQDIPFVRGGETQTFVFSLTPRGYTVWAASIESSLFYKGKRERKVFDTVYTFAPGVKFHATADAAERMFVNGYAEFNAKIVNTGIPAEFKFYLHQRAKGFYPCRWYWGAEKTQIIRLEFTKELKTDEETPLVLKCDERALNVPQLQGVHEIPIDLEITPKQDGMKKKVIPMKLMRS